MDAFLKKVELLADKASRESPLPAPDADKIMARIASLPVSSEEEETFTLPIKLFAGVGAAAAAAAAVIFILAAGAWMDLNSPSAAIESLLEVMESTL